MAPWTFAETPELDSPRAAEHMAQITVEAVVERMLEAVGEAAVRRVSYGRDDVAEFVESRPPMKTAKIRRIAVLRNDRLGDLVCTLPVFEALRQHCPRPMSRPSSIRKRLRCSWAIPTSTRCFWPTSGCPLAIWPESYGEGRFDTFF